MPGHRKNHKSQKTIKILKSLQPYLPEPSYLVGGSLRDALLNKTQDDVDLVIPDLSWDIARDLADRTGLTTVVLDQQRRIYRLTGYIDDSFMQLDLEDMGQGGIFSNLRKRDFTINAMALPLELWFRGSNWHSAVFDPLNGREDLEKKLIRAVDEQSFESDPIRCLRAFRFVAELNFMIESNTMKWIGRSASQIRCSSGERIWEEISRILETNEGGSIIRRMDRETLLLECLIPEIRPLKDMNQGGCHVDHVWEHLLKTLEYGESVLLGHFGREFNGYLDEKITRKRKRIAIVKLALLLHDIGKQFCQKWDPVNNRFTFYGHAQAGGKAVQEVANFFKLSSAETGLLVHLVSEHMIPLFLFKSKDFSPRALHRFFLHAQNEMPGILLLSLADVVSTRLAAGNKEEADQYYEFIRWLFDRYQKEGRSRVNPLLNGTDICEILKIKPSPLVGEILAALTEETAAGTIENRQAAVDFIRAYQQKRKEENK